MQILTSPITVCNYKSPSCRSLHNCLSGIGFTGSDDQWIKHYEGFESVLANLNSQENVTVNASASGSPYNSTVTKTSLETSSKASKARVQ